MVKDKISEVIQSRIGAKFSIETFDAMMPLIDGIKAKRALIRKRYYELKRTKRSDGQMFNHVESVYQCSDEFECSESFVEKCIYIHKGANIWD